MTAIKVFFVRLVSILATLGLLFPFAVREYADKPAYTPGAELPQTPFFCEAEREADAADAQSLALAFNAVYRLFGGVDREHCLVYRFGNEPTWFEWMAKKVAWCRDAGYIRELKDKIRDFPQTDNGYLWAWGDSPCWHSGNGVLHYDSNFKYVAAVAELLRWSGDLSFLGETDTNTYVSDPAVDASKGKTVYEKCALAMRYAANELGGKEGLITLTEKSAFLADGTTRFDIGADGTPVWNNTGRAGSSPSNYWDNLCFGNQDAYETALYYHALQAMRDIERMRGDEAAAAECESIAKVVKKRFDETFWSRKTGRYIACVDADGKRWDPGLTFLNTEALAYGLGDAEKAKSIFDWLDGNRIVLGDTLRGRQIMDYAGVLNRTCGPNTAKAPMPFAPVTNTLSIERVSGLGTPWWCDLDGAIRIGFRSNAFYGQHLENGGYIFYPVYHELTARQMFLGADSVNRRAQELAAVYRFNGFDSKIGWTEGLVGEFPESGIVSCVFLSSLAGVTPGTDGLTIRPHIPTGIRVLGVDAMQYRGVPVAVRVGRDGLSITADAPLSGLLRYYPPTGGQHTVVVSAADGTGRTASVSADGDGAVCLDMDAENIVSIQII